MSSLGQELGFSEKTVQRIIGDSLNVHLITVFTYGLYTIIFIVTVRHIVARGQWPVQRIALTIVVCLIWALATVNFSLVWDEVYVIFVTHGQTQDSILRLISGSEPGNWTSQRLACNLVARLAIILNAMLAELTNIWRCWEIWNRRWLVVAFPLLGVISGLLSAAFFLANLFPSGKMNVHVTPSQIDWTIVYYSVTVAVNISTTALIIFRILSAGGLKAVRTYRGVIEWSNPPFYTPPHSFHDLNWYMTGVISAITATAPTLIIGRAMAGETRPRDPPLQPGLANPQSGIQFASMSTRRNTAATIQLPNAPPNATVQNPAPSILCRRDGTHAVDPRDRHRSLC